MKNFIQEHWNTILNIIIAILIITLTAIITFMIIHWRAFEPAQILREIQQSIAQ